MSGAAPCSSSSGRNVPASPVRTIRTPCSRTAATAPATWSRGAWSPPMASSTIVVHPAGPLRSRHGPPLRHGPSSRGVGGRWLIPAARRRRRPVRSRPPGVSRPGTPRTPAAGPASPGRRPRSTARQAGCPANRARAVSGTWDHTNTAAGPTVLTAWARACRGTRPPSWRTSTPWPASSACSAYTGSTCCSSSAQARMTGRTVRAGGARVMIACRVVSSEPDSMCSIEPCPATAGIMAAKFPQRGNGQALPGGDDAMPGKGVAEHGAQQRRVQAHGGPDQQLGRDQGVRRGVVRRVAGRERGQPGGLGRRHAGRHQGPHGPQPDQVRRGVPAVPACGAAGRADSVPAFPGPQGRGGNAESPGSTTHREHRLGRRGSGRGHDPGSLTSTCRSRRAARAAAVR